MAKTVTSGTMQTIKNTKSVTFNARTGCDYYLQEKYYNCKGWRFKTGQKEVHWYRQSFSQEEIHPNEKNNKGQTNDNTDLLLT